MATLIRAAGGLVWRTFDKPASMPTREPVDTTDREQIRVRVCLVHRPRYRDWSLPKGKLHHGEHPLTAAVREIAEETGVRAVPQVSLPTARYRLGRDEKVVHYWAMRTQPGPPPSALDGTGDFEVDRVLWLPVTHAIELATYAQDAALLRHWAAMPPVTGVVLLARHAHAGARNRWPAADQLRPLSALGVADADRLCRLMRLFAPTRLVSASPYRCRQTLAPLSRTCHLPIEVDNVFDEAAADPATAVTRLQQFGSGGVTVVCSQGAVIPPILAQLATAGRWAEEPNPGAINDADRSVGWTTAKGDGWLLPYSGPRPLTATRLRTFD